MYFFSIIVYFKNECSSILEWVLHYKNWGVDHIYMVDNGSEDNYNKIIEPFIKEGFITLWKEPKINQTVGYNKYIKILKKETIWLGVLDMDEYLYTKRGNNIKTILKSFSPALKLIMIQMKIFYPGTFQSPSSIIETNIEKKCNDNIYFPKCIFQIQKLPSVSIHGIKEMKKYCRRKEYLKILTESSVLCINHYRFSSFEYLYGIKEGRGGGVHKKKYKKIEIISYKKEIQKKPILDSYLKEHSKELIQSLKDKKEKPKIELYPNSSWNKLKKKNPILFQKFSSYSFLTKKEIFNINQYLNSI